MKKIAFLMAAFMLVSLLGGCYRSETVFDFDASGGVEVSATIMANQYLYEMAGLAGADDLVSTFDVDSIEMYAAMYGMTEPGTRLEMSRLNAAGEVVPEGQAMPAEDAMTGTRLRMDYKSITDAVNSFTLINYLQYMPLTRDTDGYGFDITETRTLFGTRYEVSGKMSIYGNGMYKGEYDLANAEAQAMLKDASQSLTFKFPFAISKSNADKTGLLGSSLTWTVTGDAPEKDVYLKVTVLNPVILGMAIVILLLLAALIYLIMKKKNAAPEAYFVDEAGNPIPVYDETEEETDDIEIEELEAEEVIEEVIEELGEEEQSSEDTEA